MDLLDYIKSRYREGLGSIQQHDVFEDIKAYSAENSLSFDEIRDGFDERFNDRFHLSSMLLAAGRQRVDITHDEICQDLSVIINNARVSLVGGLDLMRNGYRLQPGLLLRNAIELCATVLDIWMNGDQFDALKQGRMKSAKSITAASKAVPLFGKRYGLFSDMSVHVSDLHTTDGRIARYTDPTEIPLHMNTFLSHMVLWAILVVSELVFFSVVETPIYWIEETDRSFRYSASDEEQEWIRSFFDRMESIQTRLKTNGDNALSD